MINAKGVLCNPTINKALIFFYQNKRPEFIILILGDIM